MPPDHPHYGEACASPSKVYAEVWGAKAVAKRLKLTHWEEEDTTWEKDDDDAGKEVTEDDGYVDSNLD